MDALERSRMPEPSGIPECISDESMDGLVRAKQDAQAEGGKFLVRTKIKQGHERIHE
jgi:hypothetical protein